MICAWIQEAVDNGARRARACAVVGISHRTVERWRAGATDDMRRGPRSRPQNALTAAEEAVVLDVLTSPRYRSLSPKQIVPQLADEGLYLASESTFYRIQLRRGLRTVRRREPDQIRVTNTRAVHRATSPNQVWSWDITWLPTPVRGVYLHLYLVMDVWSRRIVGWTVSAHESSETAAALVSEICERDGVDPRGLVLHSDNGAAMRGRTMLSTLQYLGIVPSFSRPHVADDNAYSESLFRTMKHAGAPSYPRHPFENIAHATRWVTSFVAWYNTRHRHSAIRFVTPDQRHLGDEQVVLAERQELYEAARRGTPERWSGATRDWSPVKLVELNPTTERAVA